MTTPFLLYGSYGYTGSLIAELAVKQRMVPILSGRNINRLKAQADRLGLQYRHVILNDRDALERALGEVPLVLNCAGPFQHTYRPMVEACLRRGRHYLDITGEIAVFEGLAAMDETARGVGVMLLPGVGLDVVPSDCLAAHLKQRLPNARHLTLALRGLGGGVSRGTALTSLEGISNQGVVRKDGELVQVPLLENRREIDFGNGPRMSLNIPWGDVSTAYYSTGIPNIETYMSIPMSLMRFASALRPFIGLVKTRVVRWLLRRVVMSMPPGPSEEARLHGRSRFWGEARDDQGNIVVSRLETKEGYALTADTALESVKRILQGEFSPGFQTPSLAYGPDFILEFEGSTREDL